VAEEKIQELQKEKAELLSNINQLKTDKGMEASIREKFGLAKEGEDMVVVVDDKDSPKTDSSAKSAGFFSFLKNWFK